jgi:hypothetical protein
MASQPMASRVALRTIEFVCLLAADFPPLLPGCESGPSHVIFVVNKAALGQLFFRVRRFLLSIVHSTDGSIIIIIYRAGLVL